MKTPLSENHSEHPVGDKLPYGSPLNARLDIVPAAPGVYLMKDAGGSVIYVGKAISLQSRLRSYFGPTPRGNAKVLAMVARVRDFDFIVCTSELEAFVLESNFIKRYSPRYNVLLRDDREYPYIRVTMNEEYPRILKAFRIGPDKAQGARYYGPYLAGDLYHAMNALRDIFPAKTCKRVLPRDIGKERPCLNYFIGRCIGPCRGDVPVTAYREVMDNICRFLEGKYAGLVRDMESAMQQAAERLDYEQATVIRDRIRALEVLMNRQSAVSGMDSDRDVVGIARNGSEACIRKLEIRSGRLIGSSAFFFEDRGESESELVAAFLVQHYPDTPLIPAEILLPVQTPEAESLQEFLRGLRNGRCTLRVPQRGEARRLLDMAAENAMQALRRRTLLVGGGQAALDSAVDRLGALVGAPRRLTRIEAYDVSNTGTQDKAASMVVFVDGRPVRRLYRLFKIATVSGQDDYASMREILDRRLARAGDEAFGQMPDLILVDGGSGHLSVAIDAVAASGATVMVAGMAKDRRHRTRALVLEDGRTVELLPEELPEDREGSSENDGMEREASLGLLRLITAIQDEAHRFAGSYNKKLMAKRHTRFSLEGIEGIGPARRKALIRQFGGLKGIAAATAEELASAEGMTRAAAEAVYRHFRDKEGN